MKKKSNYIEIIMKVQMRIKNISMCLTKKRKYNNDFENEVVID